MINRLAAPFSSALGKMRVGDRRVRVHLALQLQVRRALAQKTHRFPHFFRRRIVGVTEVGVTDQRHPRDDAEPAHLFRREQRDLHQFAGRGLRIDVGVGEEINAGGEDQPAQCAASTPTFFLSSTFRT
jgi:hypothetical protein